MAKDPAFLFYPGDYLRDTQCLSEKTQVAYDRIMCEHMRNICIRQQQLNFFTKRLSADEKEELMMCLTKKKGGFQISWVAESIEKRRKYSDSRRKNRQSKPKQHMLTYDSHMENENENENKDSNLIEIENIKKQIENEFSWRESICRNLKEIIPFTLKDFDNYLEQFLKQIENDGETEKTLKDTKKHFSRWLNIEIQKNGKLKNDQYADYKKSVANVLTRT